MPMIATPGPLPVAPPPLFGEGLQILWEAWDGSVWDIGDASSGVRLGQGVRGLNMPPQQRYSDKSPGVDGSRNRGFRVDERPVFWPMRVYTPTQRSQAWLDYDSAFWNTMHPEYLGTWRVVQPGGRSRTLRVRFESDNDHTFTTDPALLGWVRYGIDLIAEQPYWLGEPITRGFAAPADVPFFPEDNGDFVLQISPGSTLAEFSTDNPGQVPAYPVYNILGPTDSVTINGTEIPFPISAGKAIIIDTDPSQQTALDAVVTIGADGKPVYTLTGVERTADLGAVNFAPVQPGMEVSLPIVMNGAGAVAVDLTPRYFRAW